VNCQADDEERRELTEEPNDGPSRGPAEEDKQTEAGDVNEDGDTIAPAEVAAVELEACQTS